MYIVVSWQGAAIETGYSDIVALARIMQSLSSSECHCFCSSGTPCRRCDRHAHHLEASWFGVNFPVLLGHKPGVGSHRCSVGNILHETGGSEDVIKVKVHPCCPSLREIVFSRVPV